MKKYAVLVLAIMLVGVMASVVAIAGITEPSLLISGLIKLGTIPTVKSYNDAAIRQFGYYIFDESVIGPVKEIEGISGLDGDIRIDPKRWAGKPVAEGKVPTAKDCLLNPGKPVYVMLLEGDHVSFHFDYYQYNGSNGLLSMRILDENGRTLGTVTEENNPENKPFTTKLSSKTQKFYIEVHDPKVEYGRGSKSVKERYCYLFVEVERGKSSSQYPTKSGYDWFDSKSEKEWTIFEQEANKYTKQKEMTSVKDLQEVIDRTNKALGYKAFDIKNFMPGIDSMPSIEGQKNNKQSAPAQKSKTKRTKKN